MKTLVTAFVLSLAPMTAFAACNWGKADQTAASCAEGSVWDSGAQRCVATTTS